MKTLLSCWLEQCRLSSLLWVPGRRLDLCGFHIQLCGPVQISNTSVPVCTCPFANARVSVRVVECVRVRLTSYVGRLRLFRLGATLRLRVTATRNFSLDHLQRELRRFVYFPPVNPHYFCDFAYLFLLPMCPHSVQCLDD